MHMAAVGSLTLTDHCGDNYSCRCGGLGECSPAWVSDDDIRHAVNNALGGVAADEPAGFVMWIGPDQTGNLLEIGVVEDDEIEYVIHAMPARPQYLKMLGRTD